ncbi:PepSY domain-containing protein [Fulvivirga maritima]|uniref:PepSY-associated TM helix domain-containing protein n=1 Tax=Fulvivirga maritima TaxID=2904247 RepID=UPI001F441DD6|nr:PepSY-associated TM helix domain-containing protein [Fulvivirga maritima]UII26946.1 PepSY domain-containing protein [Fulvivirga maritima]
MSNRIYNVLFHTHTVSGLVISVALFVIFFAGSISFFRDDIVNWERQQPIVNNTQMDVDFDTMLDSVANSNPLYGRDITLRQIHQERRVMVSITPSKDTTAAEAAQGRAFFYQDPATQKSYNYFQDITLGEFIYRLHFFAQLPYPYGYTLAGFVSFFFLFAIITGVIVHWKKIISNFYLFRPWAKLKTVWTDAHTALGLIGLPFQFIYAVTGATLIIGSTIMLSSATSFFYDGDRQQMFEDLSTDVEALPFTNTPTAYTGSINALVAQAESQWEGVYADKVLIQNYGDANMQVAVDVKPVNKKQFSGLGQVAFKANSGEITFKRTPYGETPYIASVQDFLIKLHYGNFGGYALKIIYFCFGIISCFVILSGVLIWVEARDKKSNTPFKRKANEWVASIFMAISLSMYPVTVISFLAVKLFKDVNDPAPHVFLYKVYFLSWLVLSILFSIKKNNYFTNKWCLISGSILGFMVPIANGIVTGDWLWTTFNEQQIQIFVVDAFWLTTSIVTLIICFKLKPGKKKTVTSTESTTKKTKPKKQFKPKVKAKAV